MAENEPESLSKQTLEEITQEIKTLQTLIKSHQLGSSVFLGPYSYPEALKRLKYLRVRQTQFKRKYRSR